MTTNVPSITWSSTGITLPTEADILTGKQADINSAFGGGVNQDLSTPQGQLAQSETAIIGDKNNNIAYVANNMDPDIAEGIWQDAIGRIYFIDRIPAAGSVVVGTCTGLVDTVIPAGSQAQDTNGYIYYTLIDATIGSTGTVDVQFANQTTGAIACAVGALNKVYSSVTGWESVTNAAAASLGRDVETRYEFEQRRQASVTLNSSGTPQAVRGSVLAVSGVLSAYVIDNPTGSAVVNGSITIPAHALYCCVSGGAAADVANAIWTKKSQGCPMYVGDNSYVVYDTTDYQPPYPSYTIYWQTPTSVPINFAVSIQANSLLPSNIDTLITDAITSAGAGNDGGAPFAIGADVFSGRFFDTIGAVDPNCFVISVQVGTGTANQNYVSTGINEYPTVGTVTVTQV